jgi:hypothetical protein
MGAACYLCEMNYGTIPGHSPGDAVGACKLCGALACLAHGLRNGSRPAYICGCCLPNLLIAAATRQTGGKAAAPPADDPGPSSYPPAGYTAWARDIDEVADVLGDPADDRWAWMRSDVEFLSRPFDAAEVPEELRGYARPGAAAARQLLGTAMALAVALRLPEHELLPALQVALELNRG